MSARLDTLTSIKVCQQVVDSGSFMRAAERLDMVTATVSDHARSVSEWSRLSSAHYWATRGRLSLYQPCGKSRTLATGPGRYCRKKASP